MDRNDPTIGRETIRDASAVDRSGARSGETLGGRFELHEALGGGGSGTVYRATDHLIGREVAVKLLHRQEVDDRTRERLRREVRASATGHPNLVQVHELYEADGDTFLSLELVAGQGLRDRLADGAQLDAERTAAIAMQLAEALRHLHAQGLIHRDVKPGNILLTVDGAAKLCDMGLVRTVDAGYTVTETAMVMGTPSYMAPEQAVGDALTPAADIYALGLTLYRCLSGRVLHAASSPVATMMQRQRATPPRITDDCPECPRWLAKLVRWMLEPRAEDRPSADQVITALHTRRTGVHWPRRQWGRAFAALLIAVAAVVVGYALYTEPTVTIEVGDRELRGTGAGGETTWTAPLNATISQVERADLDGDGHDEVVVATRARRGITTSAPDDVSSEVLVASIADGVISHVAVDDLVVDWRHSFPKRLNPELRIQDLDGDGRPEIVAICNHETFFPSLLLVYWPRWGTWDSLLDHPGRIYQTHAVADPHDPRLFFLAFNNQLAMLPALGEIELTPPGRRQGGPIRHHPLVPPPALRDETSAAAWRAYVLLPQPERLTRRRGAEITIGTDDTIEYRIGDLSGRLDRFRNPSPGPNAGRDLRRQRMEFALSLLHFGRTEMPGNSPQVNRLVDDFEREFALLLAESPYRSVAALSWARAFANGGDRDEAIRVAAAAARDTANEDLLLLLAHLEAISGQLEPARDRLQAMIRAPRTTHGNYDATQLLMRIAIALRDRELVESCIDMLALRGAVSESDQVDRSAAMRVRAHILWNEVSEVDLDGHRWDFEPAAEALSCLARWRLGRCTGDDPARMRQLAAIRSDASAEARLALAAALAQLGDAVHARASLTPLIAHLAAEARSDFFAHQLLGLAREVESTVTPIQSAPE